MIGKKNIVFGLFYMVATLALGMYLSNRLGGGDPAWMDSRIRAVLKAGHGHGNLEALLNIVLGYLLCRLSLPAGLAKAASILLIAGAVFHSGMLYLTGLGVPMVASLTPVGAICLVLGVLLVAVGSVRLRRVD